MAGPSCCHNDSAHRSTQPRGLGERESIGEFSSCQSGNDVGSSLGVLAGVLKTLH